MTTIVILIVIAIILTLVFTKGPRQKFNKGVQALNNNEFDLAENYFNQIIGKHPEADNMLIEVTFKRGQFARRSGKLDTAYDLFSEISKDSTLAKNQLAEIDFNFGIIAEQSGKFKTAKRYFTKCGEAREFNIELYNLGFSRKLICDLKLEHLPEVRDVVGVFVSEPMSDIEKYYKVDLVYRYILQLIKNDKYLLADVILKKHLKSENQIPELESLKILLGYQKTKGIKGIISDINKLIESKDEPSSRKLETIYARIVEHEPILEDFPDYSNQILDFKKNCFSRLIHAYLNQEQWEKCLHHITSFDKFYKHPELLNNAGICCVRLVLDGEINLYNYRELISIWLTTIYTDKVILKSLDTTSWDDEYTFTIYDSIGKFSKYIFKTEVENVNKDQPSENNISIGDTQRELRKLFESGLIRSKEQDFVDADTGDLVSVIEIMESFYSSEKESIEGLIDNLPYDITICTSEFAMKYHLAQTAVDQFDKRYQKENDERFLEAGARFAELIKNKDGDLSDGKNDVEKYKLSEHILNQIINSLKSQSLEGYDSAKVNINRFDTIKAKLESEATPVIHKLISENPVNYDLIEVLYRMLSILPFSENLKYIYAEYATNYCIHGINSKSMSEIAALELLMEIIKVTPNNHRTAKSLAALISMYLTNEDFLNKVVEMIPELSELNSESLYNSFISELSGIKEELNSWKRKTNDSYIKIQDIIKVIDELQTITEPVY